MAVRDVGGSRRQHRPPVESHVRLGRNWLQFHSKHTLGLAAFAVRLLAENATALYPFYWHPDVSHWIATQASLAHLVIGGLRVLELVALAFLVWVTWDRLSSGNNRCLS